MLAHTNNNATCLVDHVAHLIDDQHHSVIYVCIPWSILAKTESVIGSLYDSTNLLAKCDNKSAYLKKWEVRDSNSLPLIEKRVNTCRGWLTNLEDQINRVDLVFIRGVPYDVRKMQDKSAPVLCMLPLSIDAECEHLLELRDEETGLPTGTAPLKLSDSRLIDAMAWLNLITSDYTIFLYQSKALKYLPGTCSLLAPNPGAYVYLLKQINEKNERDELIFQQELSKITQDIFS
jgi:hypothetical protein